MREWYHWWGLAVMGAMALIGLGRAAVFRFRGVPARRPQVARPPRESLLDAFTLAAMFAWGWELLAHSWPHSVHLLPSCSSLSRLPPFAIQLAGAFLLALAVLLYGAAVAALGAEWSFGTSGKLSATLVTRGPFAWTRNPIYIAFSLLVIGSLLLHGALVFVPLTILVPLLFHRQVLREEKFLADHHPAAFVDYQADVPRYLFRSRCKRRSSPPLRLY